MDYLFKTALLLGLKTDERLVTGLFLSLSTVYESCVLVSS